MPAMAPMPAFSPPPSPLMATGTKGFMAPPERAPAGLTSSYSSSSSFSSSSSLGAADLQAMMAGRPAPQGNNKGTTPAAWTGPIPRDATVTQTPGSAHKTYTWKVTDASGYTTTHWYSGPLGPDRIPARIQVPQELNLPATSTLGRRPIASWTGPIPRDATITQTPGSSYKTYTWKVTDASGYTTTHWYSGPLGPDGAPARLNLSVDSFMDKGDTSATHLPAQRRVAESRTVQQSLIQQQQRTKGQQQPQYRPPQVAQQQQPPQEVHHMVGQVERQQQQQQQVQMQQQHQQQFSSSESVQRISQPQQQRQRQEEQQRLQEYERQQMLHLQRLEQQRQQQEEQQRRAALEEQERQEQLERQREQERLEQQRLEQQRLEQQRLEQQRLEQQRLEQQRLEQQRLEQQRLEQQRLEQQRLEQQRLEQQRLEEERVEQQRQQQENERRIAMEEHERQQQMIRQREVREQRRVIQQQQSSGVHQRRQPARSPTQHDSQHFEQHYAHRQEQQHPEPEPMAPTGGHHVMEESTMLHIMEQKEDHGREQSHLSGVVTREEEEEHHRQEQHWRVGGEGRRPLPVPSRPNQVIQEHTSHHQVIRGGITQ